MKGPNNKIGARKGRQEILPSRETYPLTYTLAFIVIPRPLAVIACTSVSPASVRPSPSIIKYVKSQKILQGLFLLPTPFPYYSFFSSSLMKILWEEELDVLILNSVILVNFA